MPIQTISIYFSLPAILSRIFRQLRIQKNFLHQHFTPILRAAERKNDGTLDEKDFKKIMEYYGLAVPAILGESFAALRQVPMTPAERMASTAQGAMTGLFDDFFDKNYLDDLTIRDKINFASSTTSTRPSNEQLFDLFYKKALDHVKDPQAVTTELAEVYYAQIESKKQAAYDLTQEQIREITFYKGGASLVFYRTAFGPAANGDERKLLYDLGGLMQLANDIFDVFKDREAGIRTLVTTARDIETVRGEFDQLLHKCMYTFASMPYVKEAKQAFLGILAMGIFSRCYVCLEQLSTAQKSTGNIFKVRDYSRQQLICDMDKLGNKIRSAYYYTGIMEKLAASMHTCRKPL